MGATDEGGRVWNYDARSSNELRWFSIGAGKTLEVRDSYMKMKYVQIAKNINRAEVGLFEIYTVGSRSDVFQGTC